MFIMNDEVIIISRSNNKFYVIVKDGIELSLRVTFYVPFIIVSNEPRIGLVPTINAQVTLIDIGPCISSKNDTPSHSKECGY